MQPRRGIIGGWLALALAPGALCVWLGLWVAELARQEAGRRWLERRLPRESAVWRDAVFVRAEYELGLRNGGAAFAVKRYQRKSSSANPWGIIWYLTRHWVREMAGDARLAFVEGLTFPAGITEMTDADWAFYFGSFSRASYVNLEEAPIGDRQLRHLARLSELAELDLSSTPVNGEGLRYLAKLPKSP